MTEKKNTYTRFLSGFFLYFEAFYYRLKFSRVNAVIKMEHMANSNGISKYLSIDGRKFSDFGLISLQTRLVQFLLLTFFFYKRIGNKRQN